MEQIHRKAIRSNYVELGKSLDLDMMMASLIQDGIYEPFMTETFKAKGGPLARNQALLTSIETRGPNAYEAFLKALLSNGQKHLADAIHRSCHNQQTGGKNQSSSVQPTMDSRVAGMPMEVGNSIISQPTEADIWPDPNGPALFENVPVSPSNLTPEMTDNNEVYRMESKPRGLALIINNRNFRTMPERRGTEVDGRNLVHVFQQIGFNVDIKNNLKGQDMTNTVKHFTGMNHQNFDCVVLAILTHGIEGALYGSDEKKVKVEDILKYFDGNHAPTLTGKPKIIILQACRGERFDQGIESTDATGAGYTEEHVRSENNVAQDSDSIAKSMLKLEIEAPDAFANSRDKVPTMSDMLIAYATVPGYVSWRNSERGSWFIQALTEVMLQYASQEDLLSMLTKVNAKVAKAFESSSGRNKQMPAPVTMLTKKLFFMPGHFQ